MHSKSYKAPTPLRLSTGSGSKNSSSNHIHHFHHPPIRLQKSLLWTWMQALKPMLALTLARGKKVAWRWARFTKQMPAQNQVTCCLCLLIIKTYYIYIYLSYVKLMYFLLKSPGMPIGSQWKGNQSCDKYWTNRRCSTMQPKQEFHDWL